MNDSEDLIRCSRIIIAMANAVLLLNEHCQLLSVGRAQAVGAGARAVGAVVEGGTAGEVREQVRGNR